MREIREILRPEAILPMLIAEIREIARDDARLAEVLRYVGIICARNRETCLDIYKIAVSVVVYIQKLFSGESGVGREAK